MRLSSDLHAPVTLAIWMIALPAVFWFLSGAGAGTMFHWLANLLGTMLGIFGGASLLVGALLLVWVALRVWRTGRQHEESL